MRFIRMYKGSEDGAPGVTLYEVDDDGRVHRQLQVHADGVRFAPEDILMRRPVSVAFMVAHIDAEEITAAQFELHWSEFDHRRRFLARLPNPWQAWRGRMGERALLWSAAGDDPGEGWLRVPGFVRLFVQGDEAAAWATQGELFLERPIVWSPAPEQASMRGRPVQHVEGPSLARALMGERRAQEAGPLGLALA